MSISTVSTQQDTSSCPPDARLAAVAAVIDERRKARVDQIEALGWLAARGGLRHEHVRALDGARSDLATLDATADRIAWVAEQGSCG